MRAESGSVGEELTTRLWKSLEVIRVRYMGDLEITPRQLDLAQRWELRFGFQSGPNFEVVCEKDDDGKESAKISMTDNDEIGVEAIEVEIPSENTASNIGKLAVVTNYCQVIAESYPTLKGEASVMLTSPRQYSSV